MEAVVAVAFNAAFDVSARSISAASSVVLVTRNYVNKRRSNNKNIITLFADGHTHSGIPEHWTAIVNGASFPCSGAHRPLLV